MLPQIVLEAATQTENKNTQQRETQDFPGHRTF